MNKKVFVLLVITSIALVSCGKKEVAQVQEQLSETSTPALVQETVENQTVLAANYEEYNEWSLGESENTVIFFHAPYCGSCTATDKSIKETGISGDTKVLKADFDTSLELRKKYGVTKYHTFVQVDANGNEIKKWSGSMSADDISEKLGEDTMMKKDEETEENKEEWEEPTILTVEVEQFCSCSACNINNTFNASETILFTS